MTASYKILIFSKRRPGMSVEAFREYYETRHAPLGEQHARGMTRYIRRYIDPLPHPETGPGEDLYDAITELWYDDEATFRGTLEYLTTSIMPDEIVADEKQLFDRTAFRLATVVEHESDLTAVRARLAGQKP